MFKLLPLTTDNVISVLGILLTMLTIVISLKHFNKTLESVFLQQKTENSLQKFNELPELLNGFANSITSIIISTYVTPDQAKHKKASEQFDVLIPRIQSILLMYGSAGAVKIFYSLKMLLVSIASGSDANISDIYALLTLLFAQIRQDLTSVELSSKCLMDLVMPEMALHQTEISKAIEKYISSLGLSSSLSLGA